MSLGGTSLAGVSLAGNTGRGPITATLDVTEGADTLSSTGTVAISGAASVTETADTDAATGTVSISSTASVTEGADSLASLGAIALAGALGETETTDTVSSTGTVALSGQLTETDADDTLTATGTVTDTAPIATPSSGLLGYLYGIAKRRRAQKVKEVSAILDPARAQIIVADFDSTIEMEGEMEVFPVHLFQDEFMVHIEAEAFLDSGVQIQTRAGEFNARAGRNPSDEELVKLLQKI